MLLHYARDFPFDSLVLGLCVAGLPLLLAPKSEGNQPEARWVNWYRHAMFAAGCAIALTAAVRYLIAASESVDGVDFYFYLCFARDYLNSVNDPTLARYAYFPGGYRFWEFFIALVGEDLTLLSRVAAGILAANAMLCAAIVFRCTRSPGAGILAALWYLMLASRMQGLDGTTEPICTLFSLAGMLVWGGKPLRGPDGWRRSLILGACLGLAVWIKQPAGLVAFGAAMLAINYAMSPIAIRDEFRQLVAIPIAATCVLISALLLEGHGLTPLISGLRAIGEYEAHGSLLKNVHRVARLAGPTMWYALLALFFWLALLGASYSSGIRQAPWAAIVGFSLIATLATFVQFFKRESPHYALLAAPYVAIAITTMAARAVQIAGDIRPRLQPFLAMVVAGVIVIPGVGSMRPSGYFQVWPIEWEPTVTKQELWHRDPDVASDLDALRLVIQPGENLLLLPMQRNVVHFLLGSISLTNPHGYGWGPQDAFQTIRAPALETVLVLHPRTWTGEDTAVCKPVQCDRIVAALRQSGFSISVRLTSMTLWERRPGAVEISRELPQAPARPRTAALE